MKIAITGGSGNLGSKLIELLSGTGKYSSILQISHRDADDFYKTSPDFDLLIHAATCYGKQGESFSEIMSSNIIFPLKILERIGNKAIFVNIDTVLPDNVSDYAFSKACFRDACRFLLEQGKVAKVVNIRLQNFYAAQKSEADFLYNVTEKLVNNVENIDLTQCSQKWDYIFIDDVISAINVIIEKASSLPDKFNEFEIGTGNSIELKKIILAIKEMTGSSSKINFGKLPFRQNEPMNLCADITKLRQLGWSPKTSIEDGIKIIIKSIK